MAFKISQWECRTLINSDSDSVLFRSQLLTLSGLIAYLIEDLDSHRPKRSVLAPT